MNVLIQENEKYEKYVVTDIAYQYINSTKYVEQM